MSRSNYSYDLDPWELIRWRGAVRSAFRGKRGRTFLVELASALDALPEKALIAHSFTSGDRVCALGAACVARGIAADLEPGDYDETSRLLGIAPAMVREIEAINDEYGLPGETPEQRWARVRTWVDRQIQKTGNSEAV